MVFNTVWDCWQRWWFIIILVLILASTSILVMMTPQDGAMHLGNPAFMPEAIVSSVNAHMLNSAGMISHTLQAKEMVHYPNVHRLLAPLLTINAGPDITWQVRADYAKASEDMSEIYFWQHVVLRKLSHGAPTIVRTTDLLWRPHQQTLTTKAKVTITQSHALLEGVGVTADLANGTVKLLAQVTGRYLVYNPPTPTKLRNTAP